MNLKFINDSSKLTMRLSTHAVEIPIGEEVDPTVPEWAKRPLPPTPEK